MVINCPIRLNAIVISSLHLLNSLSRRGKFFAGHSQNRLQVDFRKLKPEVLYRDPFVRLWLSGSIQSFLSAELHSIRSSVGFRYRSLRQRRIVLKTLSGGLCMDSQKQSIDNLSPNNGNVYSVPLVILHKLFSVTQSTLKPVHQFKSLYFLTKNVNY